MTPERVVHDLILAASAVVAFVAVGLTWYRLSAMAVREVGEE
jgi:hypothetical protein